MTDSLLKEYLEFVEERRNKNVSVGLEVVNYSMGLVGEAAEVSELVKKWYFHKHTVNVDELAEELGDVLFYFMALSKMFDIDLEEIIKNNMNKLSKRYPKGFNSEDSIKRVDTLKK